jgi:hypothetical protein
VSRQPTPETDAALIPVNGDYVVWHGLARRLERDRDKAREEAAKWESSFDAMERAGAEQARRADENREWALKAERERDEARRELGEILAVIHRDGGHYTGEHGISKSVADAHATWADVVRERDKAREDATNYFAKIGELQDELKEAREELEYYKACYDAS